MSVARKTSERRASRRRDDDQRSRLNQLVIEDVCTLQSIIGKGTFGTVYEGDLWRPMPTGEKVAVKVEASSPKSYLRSERKFLREMQNEPGFAKEVFFHEDGQFSFLGTDKLDYDLQKVFESFKKEFPLKLFGRLMLQMLERLRVVHDRGIIHRDIKAENFMMNAEEGRVYLIDFGLAKWCVNPTTQKHSPFEKGRGMVGTPRYASLNAHSGYELSRRDDLISWAYLCIYFARKGNLPWMGLLVPAGVHDDYQLHIARCKEDTSSEDLCRGLHPCFRKILNSVTSLIFEERPNYDYYFFLLAEIAGIHGKTKLPKAINSSYGGVTDSGSTFTQDSVFSEDLRWAKVTGLFWSDSEARGTPLREKSSAKTKDSPFVTRKRRKIVNVVKRKWHWLTSPS